MKNIETNHEYRVDLEQGPLEIELSHPLSHQDALADRFTVTLRRGMSPVDLTGAQVTGYLTFANARQTLPIPGSTSGNLAVVTLAADCYAIPGPFALAMQVVSGDVRHTVLRVKGVIERSAEDKAISSGELLPTLPELLEEIADMRKVTEDSLDATEEARNAADECRKTIAEAVEMVNECAPSIVMDASDSMVLIADAAKRPACSVISTIAAVQAGEGDPSTNNVRMLTGWESAAVTRTGRNLLSHLDYEKTNGHDATVITEDAIDVTSPRAYDYGRIPVHMKAGVIYTLVIDWEVYGRDESSTLPTTMAYRINAFESVSKSVSATENGTIRIVNTYTPDADVTTEFYLHPNYNTGSKLPACSRTRAMLLVGAYTADTAPAFEPCSRQALTAELPETVFGGKLDWLTGVLTVTHGQIASYAGEDVADGWVSSTGELSTGAQVVYPLDTPYTIQLDPQTMTLLKGSNSIWSDCGDTAVAYVADTKLYIDNALAALMTSNVQA